MSYWKIEISVIIEADNEEEALDNSFTSGLMDKRMATVTLESES